MRDVRDPIGAMEEEHAIDPHRTIRAGLLIIIFGIVATGAWMALAPLSGAVIAHGVVKVDNDRKVVQHQEGGIVSAILVRDGDRVSMGQTLVELGDVQVDASAELVQTQLDAEMARSARLMAERAIAKAIQFPEPLLIRQADRRVAQLMARESALFGLRRETVDIQIALLKEQIQQTEQEIDARVVQDKADEASIRLQREELLANEKLLGEGFISKMRILGLHRAVAEYESRRGTNQAETAQARQRLVELRLGIVRIENEYMQQSERELRESTALVFDLQQRLRASRDTAQRQRVNAPVTGDVVDLRVTTVGAVIGPRERLMEIVPANPDLIVEARVRPEDVGHIRVGLKADVRLTAFSQRITPTIEGDVSYVSADRLTDQATNVSYYIARVRIARELVELGAGPKLKAGMPVEVYVKMIERTPLLYMLDPILGFLQRGLREP